MREEKVKALGKRRSCISNLQKKIVAEGTRVDEKENKFSEHRIIIQIFSTFWIKPELTSWFCSSSAK